MGEVWQPVCGSEHEKARPMGDLAPGLVHAIMADFAVLTKNEPPS